MKKHANPVRPNCDKCGLIVESTLQLEEHTQECGTEFQNVKRQPCRYFINGECWKGVQCLFSHDEAKKSAQRNIPDCRNGPYCRYLSSGVCRYFHKNLGVQKSQDQHDLQGQVHQQEVHQNNYQPNRWCRFLEDCTRVPNCDFKHYDEVFPKLPKTNSPPWQGESIWEDY